MAKFMENKRELNESGPSYADLLNEHPKKEQEKVDQTIIDALKLHLDKESLYITATE
jgi:hypothetical protein